MENMEISKKYLKPAQNKIKFKWLPIYNLIIVTISIISGDFATLILFLSFLIIDSLRILAYYDKICLSKQNFYRINFSILFLGSLLTVTYLYFYGFKPAILFWLISTPLVIYIILQGYYSWS